jgi:hypothetical protein
VINDYIEIKNSTGKKKMNAKAEVVDGLSFSMPKNP